MKEKLTKICEDKKIPQGEIPRKKLDDYGNKKYSEEDLLELMIELDQKLRGNVISFGGFCACSKILGYRSMRRVSNDLDCIINEDGINLLHESFKEQIFQTTNYGDIFLEYKGIPVGFDLEETHDWIIPSDFYKETRRFNFNKGGINSISPEYLITLKARRSILKKRFYGKDAIDTANIILAPNFKNNLEKVNLKKLSYLIKNYSSGNKEEVDSYIKFLYSYRNSLKRQEINLFEETISLLEREIKTIWESD